MKQNSAPPAPIAATSTLTSTTEGPPTPYTKGRAGLLTLSLEESILDVLSAPLTEEEVTGTINMEAAATLLTEVFTRWIDAANMTMPNNGSRILKPITPRVVYEMQEARAELRRSVKDAGSNLIFQLAALITNTDPEEVCAGLLSQLLPLGDDGIPILPPRKTPRIAGAVREVLVVKNGTTDGNTVVVLTCPRCVNLLTSAAELARGECDFCYGQELHFKRVDKARAHQDTYEGWRRDEYE
jgi:hypothetical protein